MRAAHPSPDDQIQSLDVHIVDVLAHLEALPYRLLQEASAMNILDSIMNAGNGAAVRQLGSQLGLDEAQTAPAKEE
jgi:hypothetical protein